MRFGLYRPFNLTVRSVLLVLWVVIALLVIVVGDRNPEPNPPIGLLLLGLGLFGPGLLALLTLRSPSLWDRLVELGEEQDLQEARKRLSGIAGLGLVGVVMLGWALERLF
jgi:hypothetical protein